MRTTKVTHNSSRQTQARRKPRLEKSEIALNQAFDALNLCELWIQSVPSEFGSILSDVVRSTSQVYKKAHQLFQMGEWEGAKKRAEAVNNMCELLNSLAEVQNENFLRLPLPPRMESFQEPRAKPVKNLHPSLVQLDSLIRRRLTRGSKYYKSRISNYAPALSKISKLLSETEEVH